LGPNQRFGRVCLCRAVFAAKCLAERWLAHRE
jgi:hypothetical protein